jgi:hypothetical protein
MWMRKYYWQSLLLRWDLFFYLAELTSRSPIVDHIHHTKINYKSDRVTNILKTTNPDSYYLFCKATASFLPGFCLELFRNRPILTWWLDWSRSPIVDHIHHTKINYKSDRVTNILKTTNPDSYYLFCKATASFLPGFCLELFRNRPILTWWLDW